MLSDPFESTYRGSQEAGAALGQVGQGLQQGAGAIAQVKLQDREQKMKLLGGMMGHMLDKGLINPDASFVDTMGKYFGGLGFDVSQHQTATDILNNVDTEKYKKTIKIGANNQVENVELTKKDPAEQAKDEAAVVKQAYQGLPWGGFFGGKEKQQADQLAARFRNSQLKRTGNKTKLATGSIINKGGKKWKVVGEDSDGEPLVEEQK